MAIDRIGLRSPYFTLPMELFTEQQARQLDELMLWRKELLLMGIDAHEYIQFLGKDCARLFGQDRQVVGLAVYKRSSIQCLYLYKGGWVIGVLRKHVTFEEGVKLLKARLGLL